MCVLKSVPSVRAVRQKLAVVLAGIMTCIKKIFLIVETDGINRLLLLCLSARRNEQQDHDK